MKRQIHFLFLTGWLIPVGIAIVFFGRWITEIVVPTLKGGNSISCRRSLGKAPGSS